MYLSTISSHLCGHKFFAHRSMNIYGYVPVCESHVLTPFIKTVFWLTLSQCISVMVSTMVIHYHKTKLNYNRCQITRHYLRLCEQNISLFIQFNEQSCLSSERPSHSIVFTNKTVNSLYFPLILMMEGT